MANARPDSLVPRRLASTSSTTNPTDSATACGCRDRNAEVMATTPDTMNTATVIT
jgi:hypothetical protein